MTAVPVPKGSMLFMYKKKLCVVSNDNNELSSRDLQARVTCALQIPPYANLEFVNTHGRKERCLWSGIPESGKAVFTVLNNVQRSWFHQTKFLLIATLYAICASLFFIGTRTAWQAPGLRIGMNALNISNSNSSFGVPLGLTAVMGVRGNPICGVDSKPCRSMLFIEFLASLNTTQGILFGGILLWIYNNWREMLWATRLVSGLATLSAVVHCIVSASLNFPSFLWYSLLILGAWTSIAFALFLVSAHKRHSRQNDKQEAALNGLAFRGWKGEPWRGAIPTGAELHGSVSWSSVHYVDFDTSPEPSDTAPLTLLPAAIDLPTTSASMDLPSTSAHKPRKAKRS